MTRPVAGNRRDRRYAVDVDATLGLPDGGQHKARTRDVSRNGICLITGQGVGTGAMVDIDESTGKARSITRVQERVD